jgi:hypothetical protein
MTFQVKWANAHASSTPYFVLHTYKLLTVKSVNINIIVIVRLLQASHYKENGYIYICLVLQNENSMQSIF